MATMIKEFEYGFSLVQTDEGQYAPFRNGSQCVTALQRPIAYKSQRAAENYIAKQIQQYAQDAMISDEDRAALREAREAKETAEKAKKDAAYDERLRREREQKEIRRERHVTNTFLRCHGYRWHNVGFKDEEEADAFDINAPIGTEWQLYSSDNRAVSKEEAMQELAYQGVSFAKQWLAERNIAEIVPSIEQQRQTEIAQQQQRDEETAPYREEVVQALLKCGFLLADAQNEALRLSRPHHPDEDYVMLASVEDMRIVLNGDVRCGVLDSENTWYSIEEAMQITEDAAFADIYNVLREYAQKVGA